MAGSPTQRSLKLLRDEGWTAEVVERWIPGAKIRRDLFGFLDIVAIRPDVRGVLGVQTTSHGHMSDRLDKIRAEPRAGTWLVAGNLVEIHGWSKVKARWVGEVMAVRLEDLR